MGYRVPLLRGLREPYIISHQLGKEERLAGLWKQVLLLILLTAVIYGISAYSGIGSEMVSRKLMELPRSDFEIYKTLFGIGQVVWGILLAVLTLFVPSLIFWTLLDVEYRKLIAVQFYVLIILLVEKAVNIPLSIFLGLTNESALFSFGIIAQSLTTNEFLIYLASSITVFQIWSIVVQYKYFKTISERSSRFLIIMLTSKHLFFALFSALISIIKFEKIL